MNKLKIAPARSQFSILRQICNFILLHLVSRIARITGAEDKSRTFSPWSHVVSLGYAQLTSTCWRPKNRIELSNGTPKQKNIGDQVLHGHHLTFHWLVCVFGN